MKPDTLDMQSVLIRSLRWHGWVYVILGGVAVCAKFYLGGGWWLFWPLYVWGVVLALHFLLVKSIDVDESWVGERSDDLRFRSYDLGHIRDIEQRVEDRDGSVRPADERE